MALGAESGRKRPRNASSSRHCRSKDTYLHQLVAQGLWVKPARERVIEGGMF